MQNYKDLLLWQEAHQLTLKVYEYSKGFPKDEIFGVTSQLRRACVSMLVTSLKVVVDTQQKILQTFYK